MAVLTANACQSDAGRKTQQRFDIGRGANTIVDFSRGLSIGNGIFGKIILARRRLRVGFASGQYSNQRQRAIYAYNVKCLHRSLPGMKEAENSSRSWRD